MDEVEVPLALRTTLLVDNGKVYSLVPNASEGNNLIEIGSINDAAVQKLCGDSQIIDLVNVSGVSTATQAVDLHEVALNGHGDDNVVVSESSIVLNPAPEVSDESNRRVAKLLDVGGDSEWMYVLQGADGIQGTNQTEVFSETDSLMGPPESQNEGSFFHEQAMRNVASYTTEPGTDDSEYSHAFYTADRKLTMTSHHDVSGSSGTVSGLSLGGSNCATASSSSVSAGSAIPAEQKLKKKGGWPKGKRRRPAPVLPAVKSPVTGYLIYSKEQRQHLHRTNPKMTFTEATKLIGQSWSNMDPALKERYYNQANRDKKRYQRELAEYQQSQEYQQYVKSKRDKLSSGNDTAPEDLLGIEEPLEDPDNLHCSVCNQYFINAHNKGQHLLSNAHQTQVAMVMQEMVAEQVPGGSSVNMYTQYLGSVYQDIELKNKMRMEKVHQMKSEVLSLTNKKDQLMQMKDKLKETKNALAHQMVLLKEEEIQTTDTMTSLITDLAFLGANNL